MDDLGHLETAATSNEHARPWALGLSMNEFSLSANCDVIAMPPLLARESRHLVNHASSFSHSIIATSCAAADRSTPSTAIWLAGKEGGSAALIRYSGGGVTKLPPDDDTIYRRCELFMFLSDTRHSIRDLGKGFETNLNLVTNKHVTHIGWTWTFSSYFPPMIM